MRAVHHCVESFCAATGTTEASDALALSGLAKLIPGLLQCASDDRGDDLDARLGCQLGSVDAMAACSSEGIELGASHGIGHQLGPLGVSYGDTSCILLPAVCRYNARHRANNEQQRRLCDFLWSLPGVADVIQFRGLTNHNADLADILDLVMREMGLPRSLGEVGVHRGQLDELPGNSLKDRWCGTDTVPLIDKKQVLEILGMVI
ncbi:alcohol dehydrogenase [Aspergillus heterothallicus]